MQTNLGSVFGVRSCRHLAEHGGLLQLAVLADELALEQHAVDVPAQRRLVQQLARQHGVHEARLHARRRHARVRVRAEHRLLLLTQHLQVTATLNIVPPQYFTCSYACPYYSISPTICMC